MYFWDIVFRIFSYTLSAVCLCGSVLLFLRSLRNGLHVRTLRTLAFILLMWGLPSLPDCLFPQAAPWLSSEPMGVLSLFGGNLYVIVCLLYPLELSRPGWIRVRSVALLLLPYLLLAGIYFSVLHGLDQNIRTLHNATDLLLYFGEFNVWYRLVLYLSVCFYLAYLFLSTSVSALEMRHMNDAVPPRIDRRGIAWLRFYGIGMVFVSIAYLGVLLYGNTESLAAHRLVATLFFGIIAYNGLFGRPLTVLTPASVNP